MGFKKKSKQKKEEKFDIDEKDVKIGTPEQSKWLTIKKNAEIILEQNEMQIMINNALIEKASKELGL